MSFLPHGAASPVSDHSPGHVGNPAPPYIPHINARHARSKIPYCAVGQYGQAVGRYTGTSHINKKNVTVCRYRTSSSKFVGKQNLVVGAEATLWLTAACPSSPPASLPPPPVQSYPSAAELVVPQPLVSMLLGVESSTMVPHQYGPRHSTTDSRQYTHGTRVPGVHRGIKHSKTDPWYKLHGDCVVLSLISLGRRLTYDQRRRAAVVPPHLILVPPYAINQYRESVAAYASGIRPNSLAAYPRDICLQ